MAIAVSSISANDQLLKDKSATTHFLLCIREGGRGDWTWRVYMQQQFAPILRLINFASELGLGMNFEIVVPWYFKMNSIADFILGMLKLKARNDS